MPEAPKEVEVNYQDSPEQHLPVHQAVTQEVGKDAVAGTVTVVDTGLGVLETYDDKDELVDVHVSEE